MPVLPPAPVQQFDGLRPELYRFRHEKVSAIDLSDLLWPEWIFIHPRSAGIMLSQGGAEFECEPDCVYVLTPRTPHGIRMRRPLLQAPDSQVFIRMSPVTARDDPAALRREGRSIYTFAHFSLGYEGDRVKRSLVRVPADPSLRGLLDESAELLRRVPDQRSLGRTETALLQSAVLAIVARMPPDLWDLPRLDPRIEASLGWIHSHPAADLSTPALAERLGMSPNTFARLFREQVGKTPQAAVRARRIEKARLLLTTSRLSIEEIAEHCGFCDRFYFSRVFRKEVRLSPAAYRKRAIP